MDKKKDIQKDILSIEEEAKYPNVDFDLLRDFYRLSEEDCPLSKGAHYRLTSPFQPVNISEFQFSQSSFSATKKNGTN